MAGVNFLVALIGGIIFLGFLANKFFERTKLPDVLFLIFFGLLIGPMLGLVQSTQLVGLAPLVGTIALLIIVLEGGIKLDFSEVTKGLGESSWFTVAVTVLSALFTAAVAVLSGWQPLHGLLLGFIVGGTSYEIIVPLLSKIPIGEKAKTILNLESALNDIVTIVPVIVLIQFLSAQQVSINPFQALSSALGSGLLFGVLGGWVWVKVLKRIQDKPLAYLLTIASAFLLYALTQSAGGNGTTAVIVFGLILGNYMLIARSFGVMENFVLSSSITSFQAEASFFVKTMFFVFMGIVFNIAIFNIYTIAFAFGIFIALLAARYLAVYVLVKRDSALADSKNLLVSLMPRGMATAVLASLPIASGIHQPFLEVTLALIILTNVFATGAVFYFSRQKQGRKIAEVVFGEKRRSKSKLFIRTG